MCTPEHTHAHTEQRANETIEVLYTKGFRALKRLNVFSSRILKVKSFIHF